MKNPVSDGLIDMHQRYAKLLDALPLFAEEGPIHETVQEDALVRSMSDVSDLAVSTVLLQTVRILFNALGLLERSKLAAGEWEFVSFPASLIGRSLIATMSVPSQTLVESGYWEQGSHRPDLAVEQQRWLLKELETRRERFHPNGAAVAIRTVHVACGVIKFRGRFLLHRREDRERRDTKNFVLLGGRLNMSDLPIDKRSHTSLRDLYSTDSKLAKSSTRQTLSRELEEECGLLPEHYRAQDGIKLADYQQVEGTGNKHSLSQYSMELLPVKLNDAGELRLLDTLSKRPEDFSWFELHELFDGPRADGKQAFIEALIKSKGLDVRSWLEGLPDSSSIKHRYTKETDAVDIPGSQKAPFLLGKTGKESEVTSDLTEGEWGLLILAAWHAKGLRVDANPDYLRLIDHGWVCLESASVLGVAQELVAKLESRGMQLGSLLKQQYFRVSIDSQFLFLDRNLFSFELPDGDAGQQLTVWLADVQTPWGKLNGTACACQLSRNLVRAVHAIEAGVDPDTHIAQDDLVRTLREVFRETKSIGLRKFIYFLKPDFHLACKSVPQIR